MAVDDTVASDVLVDAVDGVNGGCCKEGLLLLVTFGEIFAADDDGKTLFCGC